MSRDDCARAAAMLRDLDGVDASDEVRSAADLERDAASIEWLAAHLESCGRCSLAEDPAARALLAELRAADEGASDADFAESHARIMQAIAAEPSRASGAGGAIEREEAESAEARPRMRLATRPSGPAARSPREAMRPAGDQARSRPRPIKAGRLGFGLALAASVLLAVFVAERLPDRFVAPEPESPGSVAGIAPVEIQESGGEGDADAIWLVASGDPFAEGGATTPADLDDEDLDDLARQLGAVQG
jgi:hypothetical protein